MDAAIANLNLEAVKASIPTPKTDDDKEASAATVEKALRSTAMRLVAKNAPIGDIEKFFLFVIELARADVCAPGLTATVMQDLLDCSAKRRCGDIFSIIENHIDVWRTPEFEKSTKNGVLRMCNDLLKRLSRTIDTQFCGRVNILLARFLPLNEKSGLNLTSQFNMMNETEYDKEEVDDAELKSSDPTSSGSSVDIDSAPEIPVDFKLYQQFWELQSFFSEPNKIYDSNVFDRFQKNLNEVLTMFTTYRLDKRRGVRRDLPSSEGMDVDAIRRPDVFYAKYQTSQKLVHLQFADPQFRRYFFVQCLILANYLQSDVKFRDATLFLTEEQNKYISDVTEKCYKLLRETFPKGFQFSDFVRKLLSREKIWSSWKNEGCPDWVSERPDRPVKSCRKQPIRHFDVNQIDLGSEALNKLWNHASDNLAACKDPKRNFVPSIDDVVNDALDHADPEQGVEPEYACFNNEDWQWRCNRLFLLESDHYLTVQSTPAGKKVCPDYSEVMQKGVFAIATHSSNETMKQRGIEVSQRAEAHKVKMEEAARKSEEEARQRAEDEAKQKALEAAAERKKKGEDLSAQRAKELAEIQAKKQKTLKEDMKDAEMKEEPEKEKEREKEKEKEKEKAVVDRHEKVEKPRPDAKANGSEPSPARKERRRVAENGSSSNEKLDTRKRESTTPNEEETTSKRSRRNGDSKADKSRSNENSMTSLSTRERKVKRERSSEMMNTGSRGYGWSDRRRSPDRPDRRMYSDRRRSPRHRSPLPS